MACELSAGRPCPHHPPPRSPHLTPPGRRHPAVDVLHVHLPHAQVRPPCRRCRRARPQVSTVIRGGRWRCGCLRAVEADLKTPPTSPHSRMALLVSLKHENEVSTRAAVLANRGYARRMLDLHPAIGQEQNVLQTGSVSIDGFERNLLVRAAAAGRISGTNLRRTYASLTVVASVAILGSVRMRWATRWCATSWRSSSPGRTQSGPICSSLTRERGSHRRLHSPWRGGWPAGHLCGLADPNPAPTPKAQRTSLACSNASGEST